MLKDPLQADPTPYEIIGVPCDADDAAIAQAFKQAVAARRDVRALNRARVVLQRPLERALLDAFHYAPDSLAFMRPDPRAHPDLLAGDRQVLARQWDVYFHQTFPDPRSAHSLAVLYWWWAVHTRTHMGLWTRASSLWVMVAHHPRFLERWAPGLKGEAITDAILERIHDALHDVTTRDAALEGAIQGLQNRLRLETRAARGLLAGSITYGSVPMSCGPMILRSLGILDKVRNDVGIQLQRKGGRGALKEVHELLSPLAHVAQLLDDHQPVLALQALAMLPPEVGGDAERRALQVACLREKGLQEKSLGQFAEALKTLGSAIQHAPASLGRQVRRDIVTCCREEAQRVGHSSLDEEIEAVQAGRALVSDRELDLLLADALNRRGCRPFHEIEDRMRAGEDPLRIAADLEKAVEDLEEASALGSTAARENLLRGRLQLGDFRRRIEQERRAQRPSELPARRPGRPRRTPVDRPGVLLVELCRHRLETTVMSLAFSPTGEHLAAGYLGAATVWQVPLPRHARIPGSGWIEGLAFLNDQSLVLAHDSGLVEIIRSHSLFGQLYPFEQDTVSRVRCDTGETEILCMAAWKAGKHLVIGRKGRRVRQVDLRSGDAFDLKNVPGEAHSVACDDRNGWYVCGFGDQVWHCSFAPKGNVIATFRLPGCRSLALSDSGVHLAVGSFSGRVSILNLHTKAEVQRFGSGSHEISALAFSADGAMLAVGDGRGRVQVWSVPSGTLLAEAQHDGPVTEVAFSPRQSILASGSVDRTCRLWEVQGAMASR